MFGAVLIIVGTFTPLFKPELLAMATHVVCVGIGVVVLGIAEKIIWTKVD